MSLLSPANFLECVQRLSFEASLPGSGPTTVLNASGQTADLCNWVNQAWMDIQTKHPDWHFMRVSPGVSFVTVAGQMIYTPTQAGVTAGMVGAWQRQTFRMYLTSVGQPSEMLMTYWDYDDWRDTFQRGTLRTAQVNPLNFTILPNLSLGLQCPLAGYTITGDYFSVPTPFADNTDIPSLPSQYMMLIVWMALESYALFESSPELLSKAQTNITRLMTRLENGRLPEFYTAGALA